MGTWILTSSPCDDDTLLTRLGHRPEGTPSSTDVGRRLFCPAVHPQMSDDDLRCVAAAGTASLADVAAAAGPLAVA